MAVLRLDNASWGFPTNCYVCEPSNPAGLRIPFSHDDQAGLVFAEFTLGGAFSGAPRYIHGGVVLAVLDEAMAWAAIAVAGRFAVVRDTWATFGHPVRVGAPHRVEGAVEDHDEAWVLARGRVIDGSGRRCAEARARLVVLSAPAARSAIGEVSEEHARYLRPPRA